MLETTVNASVFQSPTLIFTICNGEIDNPASRKVADYIHDQLLSEWPGVDICVFETEDAVRKVLANGHSPDRAIVLFDVPFAGKMFAHGARGRKDGVGVPGWAHGAMWSVGVNPRIEETRVRNCAEQTCADFGRNFARRVDGGHFPWGLRRKVEPPTTRVQMPSQTAEVIARLNSGPDMVEAIADLALRERIPKGARVSWLRIPGDLARFPRRIMDETLTAVSDFERTCATLLANSPETADDLLAGVDLPSASLDVLREAYLRPMYGDEPVLEWSVRRPDMHLCDGALVASENDEMPGGFTDLVHIDDAYGINEGEWKWCFDWLCAKGPLLFVVSTTWSEGYLAGMRWLAERMRRMGYDADVATDKDAAEVFIGANGVSFKGRHVGTIWRQFPVFETVGVFADLVRASQEGRVRMVPEFAHFGNKTWFSLFWQKRDFFAARLSGRSNEILNDLVPISRLIRFTRADFPIQIGDLRIRSMDDLINLDAGGRSGLVLKVTGANTLAARSYGVFMGHARRTDDWKAWIVDRCRLRQPFIAQKRFETKIATLAVHNMATGEPEVFRCRVLMRPWMVGGRLVSSHTCCTPSYTTKVHGMVDMAVQPISFI